MDSNGELLFSPLQFVWSGKIADDRHAEWFIKTSDGDNDFQPGYLPFAKAMLRQRQQRRVLVSRAGRDIERARVAGPIWTADNNVWTMTSSGAGERYYLFSTGYAFGGIVQGTYIGWMGGIQATTTRSSIALDRAGNVWIANATPVTVSWGSTSGLTGLTVTGTSYTAAGMDSNAFAAGTASGVGAYSAVPDSAGNVWVANTDGTVSQMLGLATPVVTPLVPSKFATTPWRDRRFEP
jgi:hypothetical protein